jgi:pSer/pThr/pTyr-binding forkhead associated (FHA) protein
MRLRFWDDGGSIRLESIREGVSVVGRSGHCDLQVDDRTVSRQHARLVRAGRRLWVEDLKSSNGTYVNGMPTVRASVVPGDIVRFGKLAIKVVAEAEYKLNLSYDELE